MPDVKILITTIVLTIATTLGFISCVAAMSGCSPNWNDPIIPKPTPDNPCGHRWHSCGVREDGKHGCCYETDACRPGGYCAFVGDNFGAGRDGGSESMSRQLSPEEARGLELRR